MVEISQQPRASVAMAALDTAMPAHRLLLIKFGAIGDVVMAIPAAAARHADGYQVDWVCTEAVAPVLRLYPWIHVIEVNELKLLRGSVRERMAAVRGLWRTLGRRVKEAGGYDLIATLYYDRRYGLLSLPFRAQRKVSLSRTDRKFMLLPGRHHTDEYDRILSGRADGEWPSQLAPFRVQDLPAPARAVNPSTPRVVVVPAGARNVLRDDALRRWPVESYVVLAAALLAQGYEVVLAGGSEDAWATPFFCEIQEKTGPGRFANLIGKLSLVETLALLDSAAVTVTHDTGPLHLAGITSTAIVTLFGPTDPHGRLPHRENTLAIWGGEDFACRPCYDGRDYAPCQHNGCLAQITPATVLREVQRFVQARAHGRSLPPQVITQQAGGLVQMQARGEV